ncbi:hypothetical protein [Chitinophaga sancti]|uniref:Uncharacterized protein n=1 Tax=Chitinophaga sancti TaxID=1004 RepID=A0A1K1M4C4_9BACT|nr:hypothetical protein [Chitinophaga sancti]WQD64713.1 hypothetical protein U0033_09925 [Chitinophaga sancti]WQG89665.1 hypothetical protein SR876_32550 [Chitinophaga sancti]SFW16806.1 hypothetical protein SAMN05661012_00360 [Chitinophaga sancti]
MENLVSPVLVLIIFVTLLIVFRRVSWWYWGLDQFIRTQKKQELLLEQLVIDKIGKVPTIKVKEVATGEVVEISIDGWVDLQIQYPKKFTRVY